MNDYSHITANYNEIYKRVTQAAERSGRKIEDILILAVSKTHPLSAVLASMEGGIKDFGENYAQELKDKQEEISKNNYKQPNWHFIGHLQTNKAKYLAPFVHMIHSVDSFRLAEEISKQADKNNREIDILLQVNTSGEQSKSGVDPEDIFQLAEQVIQLKNVKIRGLMTIGSFSDNVEISLKEFTLLKDLRDKLKILHPTQDFHHLSMGMTNDYETAIASGATIVRIGTAIFGQRNYSDR